MIEQISNTILQRQLKDNGYIIVDDFFGPSLFKVLNKLVLQTWSSQKDWCTKVRHKGKSFETSMLDIHQREKVATKINQSSFDHSRFSYIYHTATPACSDLVDSISNKAIEQWLPTLGIPWKSYKTQFSLTAFNRHCFIDNHNDYTSGTTMPPYLVTIIVYFGEDTEMSHESPLVFNYKGNEKHIEPKPNRSVMFIPTKDTIHRVEPNLSSTDRARLALSGWLF